MEKLSLQYSKALYLRFTSIWGEKFTRHAPSDEFIKIWWDDWSEGLAGIDALHIKEALNECRMSLAWPPSLAEFRALCEKASGLPTTDQCLQAAIKRDFHHPLVKLVYDKVGSWALSHDKSEVLRDKVKSAYQESLSSFRKDPAQAFMELEQFKQHPQLPEPPPKHLTGEERKNVQNILSSCAAKAEELKKTPKLVTPSWNKEEIAPGHKYFNPRSFEERRKYLVGLNEIEAANLPSCDLYDRSRFMRENISEQFLKDCNNQSHIKNEPQKSGYKPEKTIYRNWMND